ncbi:MAG TPA: hypothetical protein VJS45_16535 [Acidimicrobiia bacterium]|nr:hypothetical protein [Acidimicrobiia bacterium]
MNHRYAPGRIPGRGVTGFVTFLVGLCLVVAALGTAAPARADVGPVPLAGELSVEFSAPNNPGFFPAQRLGMTGERQTFRYKNTSLVPVTIGNIALDPPPHQDPSSTPPEPTVDAFSVLTDCIGAVLLPQASCEAAVSFTPLRPGANVAMMRVTHDGSSRVIEQTLGGQGVVGLYQAGAFGELLTYGDAKYFGDLSHVAIDSPILAVAGTPSGEGYWLMEASGKMHPFGDAADLGSPDLPDAEYAIALMPTATGKGYWLVSQAGGVYTMGDAGFFGSAAGTLGPDVDIVDLAASPTGKGYWLVDDAGGVRAFGDAAFFGSAASLPPRYPITGVAATSTGRGYWLIDALGGVFAYGDAQAFPADANSYSAYSLETALADAVITIKPVPYGQGFVYGRLKGGFAGKGTGLNVAPSIYYGYGYGGTNFQQGSFAVDLAFNVPALRPSPEAGKVTPRGQAGLRAPEKVCTEVPTLTQLFGVAIPRECALTPLPPNSPPLPAPPAPAPPAPPAAPPTVPDGNGPLMPEPVWRPGL